MPPRGGDASRGSLGVPARLALLLSTIGVCRNPPHTHTPPPPPPSPAPHSPPPPPAQGVGVFRASPVAMASPASTTRKPDHVSAALYRAHAEEASGETMAILKRLSSSMHAGEAISASNVRELQPPAAWLKRPMTCSSPPRSNKLQAPRMLLNGISPMRISGERSHSHFAVASALC